MTMTTPAALRRLADELDAVRDLDDVAKALRQAADEIEHIEGTLAYHKGRLKETGQWLDEARAELNRLKQDPWYVSRPVYEALKAEAERLREERDRLIAANDALEARNSDVDLAMLDHLQADNARLRRVVEAARAYWSSFSRHHHPTIAENREALGQALAALDQEKT